MVSSQVLQKTIDELRAITRIDLCVLSLEGQKVASTFSGEGFEPEYVREFVKSPADSQVLQAYHFFKIYDDQNVEYVLVTSGGSEDAYMIGKIAVCEIQNLIVAYKERLDKNNFIQNLLLDNLLLVDIYNRAKKLRIDTEARRVVFIVETKYEKDNSAMETIKSLYASKPKDYITAIDEKNIIIVKEIKEADTYEELDHVAKTLVDMLNVEAMSQVRVSYGNIIHEIKDVSRSYKEAKMALEVGKIFYADKIIVPYNNLGIGRLIYQLPIPLCQMFMKEVFGEQLPDTFDEETLAELAASISEHGLLQPIAVRPHGVDRYLIVAGERRWRACRMAGLTEAPVVVKDVTDEQAMELALVENLQREDLDPVEEALGIRELMTRCDLTQEQAARKLGKSRSALANSLRLLNLPETVLELLKGGFLTTGHAKVVLGLPTPELQEQAAQIIADHELNVRQAEALCKKLAKPPLSLIHI